jgi:hypothetical protein
MQSRIKNAFYVKNHLKKKEGSRKIQVENHRFLDKTHQGKP